MNIQDIVNGLKDLNLISLSEGIDTEHIEKNELIEGKFYYTSYTTRTYNVLCKNEFLCTLELSCWNDFTLSELEFEDFKNGIILFMNGLKEVK